MGKITNKKKLERFYFLLYREWEILRRKTSYGIAFKKFQEQGKNDIVPALKEFRNEFHISPIDPSLSFSEVLDRWLKNIRPGYHSRPFPLESLYHRGDRNFSLFVVKGYPSQNGVVIDINKNAFISDVLLSLESILDSRGVKGTKLKSSKPPLKMAPCILNNGDIQLVLNLESTKNAIRTKVKKLLKERSFQDGVRKQSIKTFSRQFKIYDYKKSHPKALFIEIGRSFSYLYPKGLKPLQLEKFCNDDFNDAVQIINPRKRKRITRKAFQGHDCIIDLMGIDSENIDENVLDVIKDTKINAILKMDNRKISSSKVTPKLWERESQYEPTPIKIFDPEEIQKFNENLKTTERMIEIKK